MVQEPCARVQKWMTRSQRYVRKHNVLGNVFVGAHQGGYQLPSGTAALP